MCFFICFSRFLYKCLPPSFASLNFSFLSGFRVETDFMFCLVKKFIRKTWIWTFQKRTFESRWKRIFCKRLKSIVSQRGKYLMFYTYFFYTRICWYFENYIYKCIVPQNKCNTCSCSDTTFLKLYLQIDVLYFKNKYFVIKQILSETC